MTPNTKSEAAEWEPVAWMCHCGKKYTKDDGGYCSCGAFIRYGTTPQESDYLKGYNDAVAEANEFITHQRQQAVAEFAQEVVALLNEREAELKAEIKVQGLDYDEHTATRIYEGRKIRDAIRTLLSQRGIEL